jgi:hypothetical protein
MEQHVSSEATVPPQRKPWISPALLVEEIGCTANTGGTQGDRGQHGTDYPPCP